MKHIKTFLVLALCFIGTTGGWANGTEIDGIYYILDDETATASVTYTGSNAYSEHSYSGAVTIPSSVIYDGVTYAVTSIGNYAFSRATELTSVTIPASVTSIGYYAFSSATELTSVTIPASVTTIESSAFCQCKGLTNITLPPSITTIAESVFEGCNKLTNITIPNNVTTIGWGAFYDCTGLTNVIIPNSVKIIDAWAFCGCTGLTNIEFPNSVTSIGTSAFNGCTGLKNVTIPNSVTSIEGGAFLDCTGLTSVTIPNSVTSIGGLAFCGCTGLTSIVIPNSVTRIGYTAFSGCTGLTSVTIPNSVTSIEREAFYGCTGLTSIVIPNSVTSIGENPFGSCTGLTSIALYWDDPASWLLSFLEFVPETCTVNIPYGCTEVYRKANSRLKYSNLVERNFYPLTLSANYGTLYIAYPLDFSNVEGLKAYTVVAYSDGIVWAAPIEDAPANTGLLLRADEPGTFDIPVGEGSTYAPSLLKGTLTATTLGATDGDYTNFILTNGSEGIQFYPVDSEGGTLSAQKAYLPIPTSFLSLGTRSFALMFEDDNTTGIEGVAATHSQNGQVYDLQGRRVARPQRGGLYIVNGKKVKF